MISKTGSGGYGRGTANKCGCRRKFPPLSGISPIKSENYSLSQKISQKNFRSSVLNLLLPDPAAALGVEEGDSLKCLMTIRLGDWVPNFSIQRKRDGKVCSTAAYSR
jgi:hypothetical protein